MSDWPGSQPCVLATVLIHPFFVWQWEFSFKSRKFGKILFLLGFNFESPGVWLRNNNKLNLALFFSEIHNINSNKNQIWITCSCLFSSFCHLLDTLMKRGVNRVLHDGELSGFNFHELWKYQIKTPWTVNFLLLTILEPESCFFQFLLKSHFYYLMDMECVQGPPYNSL